MKEIKDARKNDTNLHFNSKRSKWLVAVDDAKALIEDHRKRIRGLLESIEFFEKMEKAGKPWPKPENQRANLRRKDR